MEAAGPRRVIHQPNLTGTSFTATSDLTLGNYQVWVRAISLMGEATGWGTPVQFRVGPVLTSPTEGSSVSGGAAFTWRTHSDAATYELWVDRVNGNTSTRVIMQTGLTGSSFTPASPLAAGTYRAWIRAVSTTGTATTWGSAVTFTVVSADVDTDAVSPENGEVILTGLLADEQTREVPTSEVQTQYAAEEVAEQVPAEVAPIALVVPTQPVVVIEPETVADILAEDACDAVMANWSSSEWWG